MGPNMKTLAIAMGVALIGVVTCSVSTDESKLRAPDDQPIEENRDVEMRQIETPEVVLQLKYDGGELNRIYLAQFRKGVTTWKPSVPARTQLCTDLCHAGLGGESCGPSCSDLTPIGLTTALNSTVAASSTYGEPRVEVCPTLCNNYLGEPLCNCPKVQTSSETVKVVDWSAVCTAFCAADKYVLAGCPPCDETSISHATLLNRALSSVEGWTAWCNVQCRQGQGGAACNCDRVPF